jgi:hypothetical protein
VIQTVSRTLKEELKFSRSAVTSRDWASYPILTFPEIPEIVMDLIDRPTERPWGAGEPAAAVVPSAISNAVFDATGVRLRSVPFTPSKVKLRRARLDRGAGTECCGSESDAVGAPALWFSAPRLAAALRGFPGPQVPRPMHLTFDRGDAGRSFLRSESRDRTKPHGLGLVARIQLGINGPKYH